MFARRPRSPRRLSSVALLLCVASFGVPISDIASANPAPNEVCEKSLKNAQKIYASIPKVMAGISNQRAEDLAKSVETAIRDVDRFLTTCAGHQAMGDMHFYKAKFLHLMSTRYRYQVLNNLPKLQGRAKLGALERAMEPFHKTVFTHADAAYKLLQKGSKLRPEALEIRAWAYLKLKDFRNAKKDYSEFLEKFPKSPRAGDVTSGLGRCFIELGLFDEGVHTIDKALTNPDLMKTASYPHLGDLLWKLNEAKGHFAGMEKAAEKVLSLFPFRMKSRNLEARTREAFDRTIDVAGFRRAYMRFVQGDFENAKRLFDEHIDSINAKEKVLQKQGKQLKPVTNIYRERSRKSLEFIENFAGKEAPIDFDLQDRWITATKPTIKNSKGKVLGVIFRSPGDPRSTIFVDKIDEFCTQEENIDFLVVSFLHATKKNVDEQMDKLRDELRDMGFQSSAGFDPDLRTKNIFRTYGAYVGSATFMIIDQNGHPVWFQQDPRTIDANFAANALKHVRDR